MKIELMGPVAPGYLAAPQDVRAIKRVLSGCGVYLPDPLTGLDGIADEAFYDSLNTFQRMHMIPFTDRAGPGSVTERVLNQEYEALAKEGAAYIWRTAGDDKVRAEHAERSGHTYIWSDPPDGENPGEDYNCRCWAEPVNPSPHVLAEEVRQRQEEMNRLNALRSMAPPSGVNKDMMTEVPLDGINPTIGPFDLLAASSAKILRTTHPIVSEGVKIIGRNATVAIAKTRDVQWIRNAPVSQLQKKFKHAEYFGIKGQQNKQALEAYRKALEKHVRSSDTIVKKGTLHKKPVTHYYSEIRKLNVIKNSKGEFLSGWKLSEKQIENLKATGNLGGAKK